MANFDAKKHVISLKNKEYLETRWRIAWFRDDHPSGSILTELISLDPPVVKATVLDGDNRVLATAHAGALDKGNAVWSGRAIEKGETAAIGRALGHAGYGTQFASEGNDGSDSLDNPVDSPGRSNGNGRQQQNRVPTDGDLTDRANATAFFQHWRAQNLSDVEILSALGVSKVSQWTQGRQKADMAVNAWKSARDAQDDPLLSAAREMGAVVKPAQLEAVPEGYTRYRLTALQAIPRGDNGHQYILEAQHANGTAAIVLYNADVFRKAGFEETRIEGWKKAKKLQLPVDQFVYVVARLAQNSKGKDQWDVLRVETETQAEHDQRQFDALGSKAS